MSFQNFKDNPFFENTKLTKAIKFFNTDTVSSCGTKINWKEGMVIIVTRMFPFIRKHLSLSSLIVMFDLFPKPL